MSSAQRSAQELVGRSLQMLTEVEKAAAFGAHLRNLTEPITVPAEVAETVQALAEEVVPGVSDMPAESLQTVKAGMIAFFRQALDLLEHPERPPGWRFEDPLVVQAQGRTSAMVPGILAKAAASLDDLADRLDTGGAFCDVGTGVGWLAIAAARQWPNARVVGIDVEPSVLELAAKNLAATNLSERIALRQLDARHLSDDQFDLVWLPGPFLPREVICGALAAARKTLAPGGWTIVGIYGGRSEPAAKLLDDLRTVRAGAHRWSPEELAAAFTDAGYDQVQVIPRDWEAPLQLIAGRQGDH